MIASTTEEDSITGVLKETSKDYLRGIGHGVTALLAVEEDTAQTEEQKRAEREREKEHQRKEDQYMQQQKMRVLEEEEQRRRKATESSGRPAAPHPSSVNASPSPSSLSSGRQITLTLSGNLNKEYMGKAYTVRANSTVCSRGRADQLTYLRT